MKTFLILAAIIFVPFIWFIVRMLRFTDETVGEDSLAFGLDTSPNRTRTYQFSASDYFGTFSKVMFGFVFVMMLVISLMLVKFVPQQEGFFLPLMVFFILLYLAFALYLAHCFYIDWQFWAITRNVSVTFDPYALRIAIEGPQGFAVFTPETISHIEHHLLKIDNYKHPLYGYGCLCIVGTDGQFVWVNSLFFKSFSQQSFLERFFPSVPVTVVQHKFPYVSIINQFGSAPTAEL